MENLTNNQMVGIVIALGGFLFALTRIKTFIVKDTKNEVQVLRDRVISLESRVASGSKETGEKLDGIMDAIRAGHDASRTAHEELRRSMEKGFKEAADTESEKRGKLYDQMRDHAKRITTLEAKVGSK